MTIMLKPVLRLPKIAHNGVDRVIRSVMLMLTARLEQK